MKRICLTLVLLLLMLWQMRAQPNSPASSGPKITGRIQLMHDYYSLSGQNIEHLNARRPDNLTRLVMSPTFTWGRFSLPFEVVLSSQNTASVTPPGQFGEAYAIFSQIKSFQDLLDFVSNPVNRIGTTPSFGSFKLMLGTHTPNYSELVQGNISVFGAGFDWSPGRFFVGGSYGIAQPAVERDSLAGIGGAFRREQYAAHIGLGKRQGSFVALNLSGGRDLPNSVAVQPLGLAPQQGLAGSLQFRIKMGKAVAWDNELGASVFTEDTRDLPLPLEQIGIEVPEIVPLTLSSRADVAGSTALSINQKAWGLTAKALYVGAGYKSFGFPFFQADRLELTLSPRFSLFDRRWNFSGSFGNRTNNLSDSRLAPMNQLLVSANLSGQIGNNFNLSLGYGNFGIRNSVANDTLRIENVSQNINIAPSYSWQHGQVMDVFSASFTLDNFEDFNVVSGELANNDSRILMAAWNRSWLQNPLSLGLVYSNFSFDSPLVQLANQSLTLTGGYRFFGGKLRSNLSVGYLLNRPEAGASDDTQWLLNAGLEYRDKKGYGLGLRWQSNNYSYGSARPDARFNENTLRLSATRQF